MSNDYDICVLIPDCHIPFEDRQAYKLMIEVFRYIEGKKRIKELVILGDYIDLYGLSLYDKDPSFGDIADLYQREIDCANLRLDEIDFYFPTTKKIFIEGNHEFRMKKYMVKFAPALRNVITIPKELKLDQRTNWKWVKYDKLQSHCINNSILFARHEPYGSAQPAAQAKLAGESFVYGHTHQVGSGGYTTKLSGRNVIAINSGCLVDFNANVFNYVKSRPNWSHAFTVVWTYPDKSIDFQTIRISKDYRCVYDGKVFTL